MAPRHDSILEARRIERFVAGRTLEEFAVDDQAIYALTKAIENLGEAARQLVGAAPGIRNHSSDIPWSDINGMRNVLVHQYFRIDVARLWRVATVDMAQIIGPLESLLSSYE